MNDANTTNLADQPISADQTGPSPVGRVANKELAYNAKSGEVKEVTKEV